MAAASSPTTSDNVVVALHPGQPPDGAFPVSAAVGTPSDELAGRLVQALASAAAAYLDLAVAFGYGFPDDLVDGWLAALVDAGVEPVNALGWPAEQVDVDLREPAASTAHSDSPPPAG